MLVSHHSANQNERIGRFEVLRKIATGGMAELFLARQVGMEGFEKVVAIKRILAHLAYDEEFINMFRDEARLVAKLSHPNIVQIYDLAKADDTYFIAMEYIPGRNLSSVAKRSRAKGTPFPPEYIARCVAQACEGLHYAHTRKDMDGKPLEIVHRDVSPQNIILAFSGAVKLVDFGIAKAATKIAHTRAGVLKGKYAYMSPEQIRGEVIDARSDIFAVGIVLYELLCGRRPFEKDNSIQTLKAIVQDPHVDCRALNPNIPDALAEIIDRALVKDPRRRFQSAQETQIALEDFVSASPIRSNNIAISRWVTDLFAEELSKERGGTVLLPGLGEVILPEVDRERELDAGQEGGRQPDVVSPSADSMPPYETPDLVSDALPGIGRPARPPIPAPSTLAVNEGATWDSLDLDGYSKPGQGDSDGGWDRDRTVLDTEFSEASLSALAVGQEEETEFADDETKRPSGDVSKVDGPSSTAQLGPSRDIEAHATVDMGSDDPWSEATVGPERSPAAEDSLIEARLESVSSSLTRKGAQNGTSDGYPNAENGSLGTEAVVDPTVPQRISAKVPPPSSSALSQGAGLVIAAGSGQAPAGVEWRDMTDCDAQPAAWSSSPDVEPLGQHDGAAADGVLSEAIDAIAAELEARPFDEGAAAPSVEHMAELGADGWPNQVTGEHPLNAEDFEALGRGDAFLDDATVAEPRGRHPSADRDALVEPFLPSDTDEAISAYPDHDTQGALKPIRYDDDRTTRARAGGAVVEVSLDPSDVLGTAPGVLMGDKGDWGVEIPIDPESSRRSLGRRDEVDPQNAGRVPAAEEELLDLSESDDEVTVRGGGSSDGPIVPALVLRAESTDPGGASSTLAPRSNPPLMLKDPAAPLSLPGDIGQHSASVGANAIGSTNVPPASLSLSEVLSRPMKRPPEGYTPFAPVDQPMLRPMSSERDRPERDRPDTKPEGSRDPSPRGPSMAAAVDEPHLERGARPIRRIREVVRDRPSSLPSQGARPPVPGGEEAIEALATPIAGDPSGLGPLGAPAGLPALGGLPLGSGVPDDAQATEPSRSVLRAFVIPGAVALALALVVFGLLTLAWPELVGSGSPPLRITTTPEGAAVFVNGRRQDGVTPISLRGLSGGQSYVLRLELAGHETVERDLPLPNSTNPIVVSVPLRALSPDSKSMHGGDDLLIVPEQ
ncbi:MAG: protein kinase [Deltaproteobacteria bacterium]|nr:protein kinase [Deltaproteobacteria bacterium]